MPAIHVHVDGDHAKVSKQIGLHRKPVIHTVADWTVDALEHGMASGATSLMVLIPARPRRPGRRGRGGDVSLQVWMMASTVLRAKFQEELEQPGWAILSDETKALLMPRYIEALRRAIPTITPIQAETAAALLMDALSAGAPPRSVRDLMGVTLERAWKLCAYLDELDAERCASDVRRAAAMTAPHGPVEGNDEWKKLTDA